ncbi:MAG: UDP-3-O-acyl-N-acetylglucosamine deacetylase [Aquificaceae bacterium]
MRQGTLLHPVEFKGVGLHSGEVARIVLHPERAGTGIRFLAKGVYIPADYRYVLHTEPCNPSGREGVKVSTVEHLLAVLYILGLDNLTVEFLGRQTRCLSLTEADTTFIKLSKTSNWNWRKRSEFLR